MIGSRACEYGMQALVFLREAREPGCVAVSEIAAHLELSPSFLSKVLSRLVERGILVSQKGPGGGVRLSKPAGEIRLIEVVEAIDGLDFRDRCAIGYPGCSDADPCPLHESWGAIRAQIVDMLSERSLEGLVSAMPPQLLARRKRLLHQSQKRK